MDSFLSVRIFYHATIKQVSTNLLPYIPISKDMGFTAILVNTRLRVLLRRILGAP